jgi:hypothetical protein
VPTTFHLAFFARLLEGSGVGRDEVELCAAALRKPGERKQIDACIFERFECARSLARFTRRCE